VAAGSQGEPAHLLLRQVQVPQADAHLPEEDVLPEAFLAQHAQAQLPLLQVSPGDAVIDQLRGRTGQTLSHGPPPDPPSASPTPRTISL